MKKLVLPLLLLFILLSTADGRFWTNQKGKSFEGEFIEADDNNVTIRRSSDRIKFTMLIKDLSDADQDYLTKLEEEKKKKEEEERKSSDDYVPTTQEELAEWIIGTEWYMKDDDEEKVVRFFQAGTMRQQTKIDKWNNKFPGNDRKYTILSANSIKFAKTNNIGTFNGDFTRMTYESLKGKSGRAKLLGRFTNQESKINVSRHKLPASKSELEKWIVGTEWKMFDSGKDKARHFLPAGAMMQQVGNSEWDNNGSGKKQSYKVMSANTIIFGKDWLGTFNEDFTKITYQSPKGELGHAEYVRRFQ